MPFVTEAYGSVGRDGVAAVLLSVAVVPNVGSRLVAVVLLSVGSFQNLAGSRLVAVALLSVGSFQNLKRARAVLCK